MNYEGFVYQTPIEPTRQAIMLAMTQNLEQEKEMIRSLQEMGVKCVATMATGHNSIVSLKLVNAMLGACLNAGVIEKKTAHIHPAVHAVQEATDGARLIRDISQNCCLKVAAVRCDNRFAVCIYGDMAIHELSAHKTIGTGYQILGD